MIGSSGAITTITSFTTVTITSVMITLTTIKVDAITISITIASIRIVAVAVVVVGAVVDTTTGSVNAMVTVRMWTVTLRVIVGIVFYQWT